MSKLIINRDLLLNLDSGVELDKELEQFCIKVMNSCVEGKFITGVIELE